MWIKKEGLNVSVPVRRLLIIISISFFLSVPLAWSENINTETPEANTSAVQVALKSKGFDPGPIDGLKGPATRRAISEFQQAMGLPATGQLDNRTFEVLFETVSAVPVLSVEVCRLSSRSDQRQDRARLDDIPPCNLRFRADRVIPRI